MVQVPTAHPCCPGSSIPWIKRPLPSFASASSIFSGVVIVINVFYVPMGLVQVVKAGESAYEKSRVCHAVLEQKSRVQHIKQVFYYHILYEHVNCFVIHCFLFMIMNYD